jgi:S1-C subfamily serine protease
MTAPRVAPVLAVLALLGSVAPCRADDSDDIYRRAVPGLVWIRNHIGNTVSTGSGFVVDADRGLVVTNHHVAQREKTVDVFFPAPDGKGSWMTKPSYYTDNLKALANAGYYAVGYLAAYDPALDLAVVHVRQKPKVVHEYKLADKDPVKADTLHMLGNPAGRDLWRYAAAIEPKIVRLRTSATKVEDAYDYRALEMSSSAFGGNSGGPVLNSAGKVVGVLSRGGGDGGKLAIAVHKDEVQALVNTIARTDVFSIENPTRGVLKYQIKWGDGEWVNHSVDANMVRTHWLRTDSAIPYIRFDNSVADGFQEKSYRLNTYSSSLGKNVNPTVADHARQYVFGWDQAGTTLDLKSK